MASIAENLQTLQDTLTAIKASLTAKGVTPSDALIDVPNEIDSIQAGSAPVLDTLNVSANGTYTPPAGTDGYDEVVVAVPGSSPVLESKTITENGTYTPGAGVDGFNEVVVNVSHTPGNISVKIAREYVGSDSALTGANFKGNTLKVEVYTSNGSSDYSRDSTDGIYDIYVVPEGSVIVPKSSQLYVNYDYSTDDGATWDYMNTLIKPQGASAKDQFVIASENNQIITFNYVKNNE